MITTQRFLMRPLTPDDASERYSRWFDDAPFIVAGKSAHGIPELRAYIEAHSGRDDALFLGIFTREDGTLVGTIKYEPIGRTEHYAVMGVFVGEREWRGRGVAAEVITASSLWLRDHWGIDTIILGVDRDNATAIRVFEKTGFRREHSDKIPPRDESSFAMVWRMDKSPAAEVDAMAGGNTASRSESRT